MGHGATSQIKQWAVHKVFTLLMELTMDILILRRPGAGVSIQPN